MADRCPIFCLPLLFSFVSKSPKLNDTIYKIAHTCILIYTLILVTYLSLQLFRCISNDTAIFDALSGKR